MIAPLAPEAAASTTLPTYVQLLCEFMLVFVFVRWFVFIVFFCFFFYRETRAMMLFGLEDGTTERLHRDLFKVLE